jgi:uncharacterized protein
VRFRRNAPLDPGQVTDVRGRGVGPGGIAVGGGGLGIVGLVVYLLIALFSGGGNALGQLAPLDGQQVGQGDTPADINSECRTGQDANRRQDCRIVAVLNSVQKFWDAVFQRSNRQYQYVDTVFFSGQADTGCGTADSQVGPFYCPVDKLVYIDLGFFDELGRFGARDTPFVEELNQADVNSGLDAAGAIGDDRIQQETQGQVNPETWTHGSSEQRRRWFSQGYEKGRPAVCDTFSGSI